MKTSRLLLLFPLLAMGFTSCDGLGPDIEQVDLGPAYDAATVAKAENDPIKDMDPAKIQAGEFRYTGRTQEIAGVTGKQMVSAEGVTIISRDETTYPDKIILGTVVADVTFKS